MIKIVDIADEIWRDLNQTPDLSIAYISFWLRANIGALNNLILTNYVIDPVTLEITDPTFGDDEKDIFKDLINIKYLNNLLQKALYGGQYDRVASIADGDGKITRVSLNDLAKTLAASIKQANTDLNYKAHLYKYGQAIPNQTVGTDNLPSLGYPCNPVLEDRSWA